MLNVVLEIGLDGCHAIGSRHSHLLLRVFLVLFEVGHLGQSLLWNRLNDSTLRVHEWVA